MWDDWPHWPESGKRMVRNFEPLGVALSGYWGPAPLLPSCWLSPTLALSPCFSPFFNRELLREAAECPSFTDYVSITYNLYILSCLDSSFLSPGDCGVLIVAETLQRSGQCPIKDQAIAVLPNPSQCFTLCLRSLILDPTPCPLSQRKIWIRVYYNNRLHLQTSFSVLTLNV